MKELAKIFKDYKMISPYDLAMKLEELPEGEEIEFYMDDLQHMDDFKMPEQKHYMTISYLDHYPNLIAGKDDGGFTFIKNMEDYTYSPWGLGKFVRDYLAEYNQRFHDGVYRIYVDCPTTQAEKTHGIRRVFHKS